MKVIINVDISDGDTVELEVTMRNGKQCIGVIHGSNYQVDTLIDSWKHAWNLNGVSEGKVHVAFSALFDAVCKLRLDSTQQDLTWYKKMELLQLQ